jgi:hypothetical protein
MSSKKDLIINQAYEDSNYAGIEKLYTIIKKTDPTITKKEIKDFLDNQIHEQILKQTINRKSQQGHITSLNENQNWQIDIFDLSKYAKYNSNYKYIFAVVDVFTRKLYAEPMKDKTILSTTKSLESVITKAKQKPEALTSDNDSSFLGKQFQDYLNQNKITLQTNIKNDHNALGIIDNMARRLKLTFGKIFIKTGKKNWIDYLQQIVNNYNNLSNRSLNKLSPNEVMLNEKNEFKIRQLNLMKLTKNKTVSDLSKGDKVRIKISGKFTKSSEPQFSDKVYEVSEVKHSTIYLTDGQIKKRQSLLKVPINTISNLSNPIKEVHKESTVKRKLNKEGVSTDNIIREKRIIKRMI